MKMINSLKMNLILAITAKFVNYIIVNIFQIYQLKYTRNRSLKEKINKTKANFN